MHPATFGARGWRLTRSEVCAHLLRKAGAEVLHGNLEAFDSLRERAANLTASFTLPSIMASQGSRATAMMTEKRSRRSTEVLLGSNLPFVNTSDTAIEANAGGKQSTSTAKQLHGTSSASLLFGAAIPCS